MKHALRGRETKCGSRRRRPHACTCTLARLGTADVLRLLSRASVVICHYASTGVYETFRRVLHPSSVAMVLQAGIPLLAPDLPAVREIARGTTHLILYRSDDDEGLRGALKEAEERFGTRQTRSPSGSATEAWDNVGRHIQTLHAELAGQS